jgi:hypothetical protein
VKHSVRSSSLGPATSSSPGRHLTCVRSPSLADSANGTLSLRVPSSSADGLQRLGARPGPVAQVARGRSTNFRSTTLRPVPPAPAGTSRGVPASHATATTATKEKA